MPYVKNLLSLIIKNKTINDCYRTEFGGHLNVKNNNRYINIFKQ